MPKDLEPVVAQLKGSFGFKSYRLLDVLNLRARTGQREGEVDSQGGQLQIGGTLRPVHSQFRIRSVSIAADGRVRIDGLQLSSSQTSEIPKVNLGLNTDIDIKEGQKLVVGRMGIAPTQALFMVLTAHVEQ